MLKSGAAGDATTLPEVLHAAAAADADTSVVLHSENRGDVATVGQLYDESLRVAASLHGLGVHPGDVVAVQLPNWRECLVAHAAAWLSGAVLLPIVPIYGPREVSFILRQSAARVFVTARSQRQDTARILDATTDLPALAHRIVVGDQVSAAIPFAELAGTAVGGFQPYAPSDTTERCVLVYTSGTTSEPKGVLHTHSSLLGEINASEKLRGVADELVSLATFPSGHIAGVLGILRTFIRGASSVTLDGWDPLVAARLIVKHGVGTSAGTPFHLRGLLAAAKENHLDLSCVQDYMTGAASVTGGLIRRADAVGIRAFRSYGSTEHPTLTIGTPDDPLDKRADTDGRVSPGSQIRIVDDAGEDVHQGLPGEVLSKGPELFTGYLDSSLNDTSMSPEGWFHTGDIGIMDADGYLRITDRKKDIIVRGGENISSSEVEGVLLEHPAISQAAVVGLPDDRLGERVCAVVVLKSGHRLDMAQIQAHFRVAGLARQKTPETLTVVNDLPRTASGKVQKQLLRRGSFN